MEWLVRLWDYIAGEWRVIGHAPVLFGAAVVLSVGLAGFVIWRSMEWRYGGVEANLQSTITTQRETIVQLQEQLRGTSPQIAAIQAGRDKIRAQLQSFYIEGAVLFNRQVATAEELTALQSDTGAWAKRVAEWTQSNMGEAALAKVFDPGSGFSVNWGKAFNAEHSNTLNYITMLRRNISTLIETAAWDGRSANVDRTPSP